LNTVSIDGKVSFLPASWDELTRGQLIYLAGLFRRGLTEVDFRVHLLWRFMKMKPKMAERIDEEDLWGLTKVFDFIFTDVKLTRNLIHRIGRYMGPSDAMMNCSFGEFTRVQMRMEDFSRTGEEKYLDEMVAIMYRTKKRMWLLRKRFTETSDCRVKYIEKDLPARAKKMAKVDHAIKYAVFLFVTGVLCSLPEHFPNVYRKKGDNEKNPGGWAALIISLADGKTDDESLDRVFHSNMYNVFMGLEQKAIEYFRFLKETKQND